MESPITDQHRVPWLIRVSETFEGFSGDIIQALGGEVSKRLGNEYYLIRIRDASVLNGASGKYLRWNLPVDHAWPCNPEAMDGFVEKAAQALFRKFSELHPQAIFVGQIDPSAGSRYYKSLASNLRGRILQLFPANVASFKDVEAQDPVRQTLFCLVGKEGLFCGMQSPQKSNGLYPGGTKYISQGSPDTISRAGAKLAEALHYLLMYRNPMEKGTHWLELGASPGGMTSELLARGYKVTALDRAPLDKRLDRHPDLIFGLIDAAAFMPNEKVRYDAILSDMNGDPREAIRQVVRLSANLNEGGLVIFTLKTAGISTFSEVNELYDDALAAAVRGGLRSIAVTHLTYNRAEFTLFLERDSLSHSSA